MFYWVVKAILTPILRVCFRPWVQGAEHLLIFAVARLTDADVRLTGS